MRKVISLVLVMVFLNFVTTMAFAQARVTVMTLRDGRTVSMTQAQLNELAKQPGITISSEPTITATQIAIPIPAELGGGFIVAEAEALANALNATGITVGVTAADILGAKAAAGAIIVGSKIGAAVAAGVTTGTVAAGALAAAAALAAIGAATGGKGPGAPVHHVAPVHH